MSLPRAIDWITQYMQYTCIPNDSFIVNNTVTHLGGYYGTVWILFLTIAVYVSCLRCISLWISHSRSSFSVASVLTKNHQTSQSQRTREQRVGQARTQFEGCYYRNKYPSKCNIIIFILCVVSWHAFQVVDSKPLPNLNERQPVHQDPRYAGATPPPRILMPPLDLGFRGQIASEEKQSRQNNLASNYQSDESVGNRWIPETYPYAERPQQSRHIYGQFVVDRPQSENILQQPGQYEQYSFSNGYAQNQWTSSNEYNPNQYPVQYLQSRDTSRLSNTMAQPKGQYVGAGYSGSNQQTNIRTNMFYPPSYSTFGENMNEPVAFPPTTSNRNPYENYGLPRSSSWYSTYNQQPQTYYAYNDPAINPRLHNSNDQPNPTHYRPTNVLGHHSNYDVITEEEIERRLKDYTNYLANNKNKESTSETEKAPEHHDSGLRLKGSHSYEKVLREFNKIASQITLNGIDTLFDEIDLNKDGMIKLEEFRTFLWFHEIGIQD